MKTSQNLSDAYDPMGDMLAREAMQCHAHGCDGATGACLRLPPRVWQRCPGNPALGHGAGENNAHELVPSRFVWVVPVAFLLREMLISVSNLYPTGKYLDICHSVLHALHSKLYIVPALVRPTSARKFHGIKPIPDVRQMGTEIRIEFVGSFNGYGVENVDHRVHSPSYLFLCFRRGRLCQESLDSSQSGLGAEDAADEYRQLYPRSFLATLSGLCHFRFPLLAKPLQVRLAQCLRVFSIILALRFTVFAIVPALPLALFLGPSSDSQRGNRCARGRDGASPTEGRCVSEKFLSWRPDSRRDVSNEETTECKRQPGVPLFALLRQRIPSLGYFDSYGMRWPVNFHLVHGVGFVVDCCVGPNVTESARC